MLFLGWWKLSREYSRRRREKRGSKGNNPYAAIPSTLGCCWSSLLRATPFIFLLLLLLSAPLRRVLDFQITSPTLLLLHLTFFPRKNSLIFRSLSSFLSLVLYVFLSSSGCTLFLCPLPMSECEAHL